MNRIVEKWMYRSRWLFAPVYIGLSLGLLALTIKFFQSMYEILPNIFALSEADLVLRLLSLIDLALVGGLLIMVIFSGYENFITCLLYTSDAADEHRDV